jgi:hydroxyquinol 1,2-dioxygenase
MEFDTHTLTDAVIARMDQCGDARFKEVMTSLVRHLHEFVREVDLRGDEWFKAIEFLTATGKKCDEKRQEFILLSDTLGVSMLVVALAHAKAQQGHEGATPPTDATVQGPFYWEGAPELPLGSDIAPGVAGEPALYSGRVTDTAGKPLAGALLDIWSSDGEGFYDVQQPHGEMRARARVRADQDGRYWFWSIRPAFYPVPTDGPVGDMLRAMGRHPNRPGHLHMKVTAPGHRELTTHLFDRESHYLDSDAVFGVRDSLIVDFERHAAGTAKDGRKMDRPYHATQYDFRLIPA